MNVGTGVTVRNTQRIGEILMNKKLVAIMTFVLIALGATMTISSHNIGTQNCKAPSVVNSLTLPYLVQKDTLPSPKVVSYTQENHPSEQKDSQMNDTLTNTEEQSKTEAVLQPTTSTPTGGTVAESVDGFMPYVEQLIFDKVNQEREKAGVAPLENNSIMTQYAKTKSKDMGERQYFSHENPEGNLMNVFMQQDGIQYQAWGENIAYIGGDMNESLETIANQFMLNWMNSQGHRENILSPNFTGLGIGVYRVGNKIYATQEFYR